MVATANAEPRDINKIVVGCTVIITQNDRSVEDMTKAFISRAAAFYRQQQFDSALADFNEAVTRSPRSAGTRTAIARCSA